MLRSEHLRGLSKEVKRTTVLVALDAAGISVDEVTEDAKARMAAIDSYEAEQRKQFEAHLTRKAEENQHIMAELERIKASYAERLRRNLEGVAREKATFGNWLTTKQQEAQNIVEALELFANKPEVATANNQLEATLVSPSAKPV
jgi:predicted RNase H-like nuclease (RuvC/YqgF family)